MRARGLAFVVVWLAVCPMVWAQSAEELPAEAGGDWFARVQEGIRDGEYRFSQGPASYRPGRGEVWQAPNRALDLRVYFDGEGFEILERSQEGAPTIARLALTGWGREGVIDTSAAGALREDDGRMERLRGALTEHYANTAAGLELVWTLSGPPPGEGALVLELELDHATARAKGGGVEVVSEIGRRLLLQAPAATAREGAALPAEWVVVERDRLELRVVDGDALYPLRVKSLLTGTADAFLESDQASTSLGKSVSTAGDVNGDGFDDIIVGAREYDNGQSHEGVALVFLGSAAGIVGSSPADAHAMLQSDQVFAELGGSVSTAGDVNGDGFADIIVGAGFYNAGENNEGAALVFLGSAAGIVGSNPTDAHALLESDQAGALMGWCVSTAGDVNGDGFADVIAGAPHYSNGENEEGAAFVFLGSAAGIVGSSPADAHAMFQSDQADAHLGVSVSTAGDVNGDGFADVITGASGYDHGESDEGAAFVFLGSASGVVGSNPTDAHALLESQQVDALLGDRVSTAGDVNGDGFADVIVGAPYYVNGQYNEGAAFVFLGSASGIVGSSPADAHATIESDQGGALLGIGVSTAGDVNGDGFSDVVVGAHIYTNGEFNEGAAFVFLGSSAGIVGSSPATAHAVLESNQENAYLGWRGVSTAGDVNGDGFSDVIVGAPAYDNGEIDEGAAFVFHGSATGIDEVAHALLESQQADAELGLSASTAGDVNGDGFADVIVGARHYDNGETDEGAAFVFHGSAAGIVGSSPAVADAHLESDQIGAELGRAVSTAGDVNGDGFADVIAGARYYDNGEIDEGAALVFLGSAAGIVGSSPSDAHALLESDQASADLGLGVSTAGDVNGDGFADVIVGARGYDKRETDEGAALVFLGSADGIVGSSPADAHALIESDQAGAELGWGVSTAGDVNGDGFADVITGAPYFNNGENAEGVALLFLGSAAGVVGSRPADSHAVLESDQVWATLGVSVSTAGDVNGDGYADVIVGARQYDNPELNEGAAFVFLGSASGLVGSNPSNSHAMLESDQALAFLAYDVSTAGDVNGDGFADVIVGAHSYDNGQGNEGAAFVFLGSAAGVVGSNPADADAQLESDQASAQMGYSVSTAGDVNGDGFADVIVGAPFYDRGHVDEGAAFVFLGNSGGRLVRAQQLAGSGGLSVQPWGASGIEDGFTVQTQATSPRGRERARIQLEACPTGAPFGSFACSTWTSPEWIDTTASPGGVEVEITAGGLQPGELYRWRVRTLYLPYSADQPGVSPPFNPTHGPWRRLGAQAQEADIRVGLVEEAPLFADGFESGNTSAWSATVP